MFPKKASKIKIDRLFENSKKRKMDIWKPTTPTELYTLGLLIFTAVLALISIVQIFLFIQSNKQATESSKAALKAAEAATESNQISRQIMIAEQRPWIKHEVGVGGTLSFTKEKGWVFPLRYILANIGKSPGTMVSFYAQVMPFNISVFPEESVVNGVPQGNPLPGTSIEEELEKIAKLPEDMEWFKMGFGQILFPNDEIDGLLNIHANNELFELAKEHEGYSGQFLVLTCVKYGSTLDAQLYRTAKSYSLWKTVKGERISLNGENIAVEQLALTENPQLFSKIVE